MKYILQFNPKLLIHETVLFAPASIYGSIEKHHFCKFLIFDFKKSGNHPLIYHQWKNF